VIEQLLGGPAVSLLAICCSEFVTAPDAHYASMAVDSWGCQRKPLTRRNDGTASGLTIP
jgi:hypothetical protein